MTRHRPTLAALAGLLAFLSTASLATLHVGDIAPNFTAPDTAGIDHSLTDYRGRVAMLTFWQSTCQHCRNELPRLQVMYDDYGGDGFVPVTLNLNESIETVKYYARQYTYPFLRDNGGIYGTYRQNGYVPLNYVVDPDGIIRYIAEGFDEAAVRQVVLQYLPGPIEHDVGVTQILAPSGNVDSADAVVPACSVYNYATHTETYTVRMHIGTEYDTVAPVTDHEPGTSRLVEFPTWTATERGQLSVTCTTELSDDDIPYNDRKTGMTTVRVYDLAVTAILAPGDTVDSASSVVPRAEVRNFGTVADMALVRLAIGDDYLDSVNVPLHPDRCDTATFNVWVPNQLGEFAVRCSVSGRWEMVPENNLLTGTVQVVRTGVAEPSGTNRLTFLELHPNPTAAHTTVRYSLERPARVDLHVYAASGEHVRVLRSGPEPAGVHLLTWDGRDDLGFRVGRGVYYCRLATDGFRVTKKLVVTR